MFMIVFLSHVAKICDKKSLDIYSDIKTIGRTLVFLYTECNKLKPYLADEPQELILLMDSMNILPDIKSSRTITSDLYVSPIIGGGNCKIYYSI